MTASPEFLWYIPKAVKAGHRGDVARSDYNSLDTLTARVKAIENDGWNGALIGTGRSRPDTFTVTTALAARTTTFEPLIAMHVDPAALLDLVIWRSAHGRLTLDALVSRDTPRRVREEPSTSRSSTRRDLWFR